METPAIAAFGTRQRDLLTALLEQKDGLTADELAGQLRITRSAVHQHLATLEQSGYIEKAMRGPRGGRPGYAWSLTERGIHLFPKQYALFADLLIRSLRETLGSEGLTRTLRALADSLARTQRHRLEGKSPSGQVVEAAAILRELGYQARAADDPGHELPLIDARNCVYHHLASANPEVCQLDLALLENLLDAGIEHVECMVRGGRACRFRLRPRRG